MFDPIMQQGFNLKNENHILKKKNKEFKNLLNRDKLDKPLYVIARFWLTDFKNFEILGDDKEEIIKIFNDKYKWDKDSFGVTEENYVLYEVNFKELMKDKGGINEKGSN